MRSRAHRVAAVVVTAVLATACGAVGVEDGRPAADGATVGGTLHVGITSPRSLDPAVAQRPDELLVASTLCDTLVAEDPVTGELVGGLAESWTITGSRVLLKLRRDVRFTDGTEVTPKAVVASLQRLADPEFASPMADLLAEVAGYAEFRGDVEVDDEQYRRRLAGIWPTTSHGVGITLSQPNANFLAVLAHPATAPVSVEAADAAPSEFRAQPVCVGPYRVAEPWPGEGASIRVERAPDYHGRHAAFTAGGAGYVDRIVFEPVGEQVDPRSRPFVTSPDAAPAPLPSLDGLDVVRVPAWRWARLRDHDVATAVGPGIDYIGIPTLASGDATSSREEIAAQQAAVRRALSLALDRELIASRVYAGGRVPATLFPKALDPGHGVCATTPPRADVAAARAELDSAGIDVTRESFDLVFNDEFTNADLVAAVADQWRAALGMEIRLKPASFDDLIAALVSDASSVDLFRMSWSVAHPSLDAWLYDLFHSGQSGRGNLAGYANVEVDELLGEEAREVSIDEDRALVHAEAVALLCDELPMIPVVQQNFGYAVAPRVSSALGVVAAGYAGQPLLRELFVSPATP